MANESTSRRKKAGYATLALVGLVAAGGTGASLNALFTDTVTSDTAAVNTGNVKVAVGDQGTGTAEFSDSVGNMAAGDTVHRFFSVSNSGSLEIGRLEAVLATSGPLASDGTAPTAGPTKQVNGELAAGTGGTPMHLRLDGCSGGEFTLVSNGTPSCSGTLVNLMKGDDGQTIPGLKTVDGKSGFISASDLLVPDLTKVTADTLTDKARSFKVNLFDNLTPETEAGGKVASQENVAMKPAGGNTFASGTQMNYMVTYTLPQAAKNEYQGTQGAMKVLVTATQRNGKTVSGSLTSATP